MITKLFHKLFRKKHYNLTISAIVTRANGKIEDLGIISRGNTNFKIEEIK